MTIPNLVFAFLVSTLLGAIFHIIRGGDGWRLLLYVLISCAGFFVVNWLGQSLGWSLYPLGGIDTGLGIVGSVIVLIFGDWLIRR